MESVFLDSRTCHPHNLLTPPRPLLDHPMTSPLVLPLLAPGPAALSLRPLMPARPERFRRIEVGFNPFSRIIRERKTRPWCPLRPWRPWLTTSRQLLPVNPTFVPRSFSRACIALAQGRLVPPLRHRSSSKILVLFQGCRSQGTPGPRGPGGIPSKILIGRSLASFRGSEILGVLSRVALPSACKPFPAMTRGL
jgi:hypothetical protein